MRQKDGPDQEIIDGVQHLHVGPRVHQPPLRSLGAKLRFMGSICIHLARHRYDVVDCQTYAPLPAAWFACKLRHQPMVATIHDTAAAGPARDQWLSRFDRRLAWLVERCLYRLPYDQVLTVSSAVKADLVQRFGLPTDHVATVPNCIDVQAIVRTPADAEPADLVFVGRLIPHKHPADVLKVLLKLNAERRQRGLPLLRAKFVGGGPLAETLRDEAAQLGVAEYCAFCGELPLHEQVVAHIRSARVLLLPSTREGFGLVLAEALAAGTAAVAYDIPAVRETLGPELAACLVPAGDVDALAHVVRRLLDDNDWHAHMLSAGLQRVLERFDAPGFARRVATVYQACLARHAHR